ncbi:MAG: hypothetical protein JXX28_00555 [Deltaproteobacteria bacterium]|nr:hypothetical protein [Deltaproteobacteria bacterium]
MDKDQLYDVRTLKHRITTGTLKDWTEYDAYLETLEDEAAEAQSTEARFVPTWASNHRGGDRSEA